MRRPTTRFALCLENAASEASLIRGKVYLILSDSRAAKDKLIRVVDESGSGYLFAKSQFAVLRLPQTVRRKLIASQKASRPLGRP